MFEYFKPKKNRDEQAARQEKGKQVAKNQYPEPRSGANSTAPGAAAEGVPILNHEDEEFLERLTSSGVTIDDEDDIPPPLPPRITTPVIEIESETSSMSSQHKKDQAEPAPTKARFGFAKALPRSISLRKKPAATSRSQDRLSVPADGKHRNSEDKNFFRVLDDLDLTSRNNRAVSLSAESASLAHTFTQILRDLVNGVPTAYGDLTRLLDDSDGLLSRNYARLPSSLKKLVAQLPEKLTSSLAPELLAVASAAEAQALGNAQSSWQGTAKRFLTPSSLRDLVSKPGALISLLKGIMNALKTRFPAFVGTNVLWSLAVFLLLFMLWYCHKRGREERLEREARAVESGYGAVPATPPRPRASGGAR